MSAQNKMSAENLATVLAMPVFGTITDQEVKLEDMLLDNRNKRIVMEEMVKMDPTAWKVILTGKFENWTWREWMVFKVLIASIPASDTANATQLQMYQNLPQPWTHQYQKKIKRIFVQKLNWPQLYKNIVIGVYIVSNVIYL